MDRIYKGLLDGPLPASGVSGVDFALPHLPVFLLGIYRRRYGRFDIALKPSEVVLVTPVGVVRAIERPRSKIVTSTLPGSMAADSAIFRERKSGVVYSVSL
jgi:hypothetical protein